MPRPTNIAGWPFPVMGPLSAKTKEVVVGKPEPKKVAKSIQALQKERLKKFDDSMNALFNNFINDFK